MNSEDFSEQFGTDLFSPKRVREFLSLKSHSLNLLVIVHQDSMTP